MAIEGPLRELGIHDVFQLLDLSRKTGVLRVTSELRDDEGIVFFDGGASCTRRSAASRRRLERAAAAGGQDHRGGPRRARDAQLATEPRRELVELLVESGAITQRELERQLRLQIESVVFELMSWREGFFSFEERTRERCPARRAHPRLDRIAADGGARRIDEWSRIADKVPNLERGARARAGG